MKRRHWRWGFAIAVLPLTAGIASITRPPLAETPSARCGSCHAEIAEQWASSMHAAAWSDPIFQVSFRHAQHPWCLSCHAPLEETLGREEGVGCVACHLEEGQLVAVDPSLLAHLAHPIRADPEFAEAGLCARCHQFDLPTHASLEAAVDDLGLLVSTGMPSQDTWAEWSDSGHETCQSCHMAEGAHRFPGVHDRAYMRGALTAQADATPTRVDISLRAVDVGHASPTGDPFHRMRLLICASPTCEQVIAQRPVHRLLAQEGDGWRLVEDTRIPASTPDAPSERVVSMNFERPLPTEAAWRLVYHLADPTQESELEDHTFIVASGLLFPTPEEDRY